MATKVLHGINLTFQKRMAMAILKCGQRKVWLDPTKKPVIEEARTREAIRDLIARDVIQYRPGIRGKKTKLDGIKNGQNPLLRRIKQNYLAKQENSSTFSSMPSQ